MVSMVLTARSVVGASRALMLALAIALAPACASVQSAAPPAAAAQAPSTYFLFLYRPGPAWRAGVPMNQQGLAPHGAYMQRLLREERLLAGGGFTDIDGGMAVVRAASMEEARALLAADPAITSGIFVADVRHWRPRFRDEIFPR